MKKQRSKVISVDGKNYHLLITEFNRPCTHDIEILVKEPLPELANIKGNHFGFIKETNQIICKTERIYYGKKIKALKVILSKISFMNKLMKETAKEVIKEKKEEKNADKNTSNSNKSDSEGNTSSNRKRETKSNKEKES